MENRLLGIVFIFLFVVACASTDKADVTDKPTASPQPEKQAQSDKKKTATIDEEDDMQVLAGIGEELKDIKQQELAPAKINVSENDGQSPALEIPDDPNAALITVDQKNLSHPNYGVGDKRGFIVNGRQGATVIVKRGETFTFQVRTGVQHDFYISTSSRGWGSAVYQKGVKDQFTYRGDVELTTDESTPGTLYYQCRNHRSMGGKIMVVEANTDVTALRTKLDSEQKALIAQREASPDKASKTDQKKAQQKLAYADMMLKIKSKNLSSVALNAAESRLAQARDALASQDFSKAYNLAEQVSDQLSGQIAANGPSEEELAAMQTEYQEKLLGLESIVDSHNRAYESAMKAGSAIKPVDYDRAQVADLKREAAEFYEKNQYDQARITLSKAENMVTKALNEMMSEQTIVYELKFATPKDEYMHEVGRYKSYEELIPVALEMKKPSKGAISLMERFKQKAEFYLGKADESAAAGRYDEAIVIVRDATLEIRRGLMSLGVTM